MHFLMIGMADTLDKIVTFFRVSPAQQVIALGMSTPATVLSTYSAIENYSQGNIGAGVTNTLIALANIGCFLFNEYLAIGKMQEYRKVKSALDDHGWDERIIEPKSHSWCQRNMAQVASEDSGFGNEAREYLKDKGYKRYNFIPYL
jgi:hypothetical protein